MSKHDKSSGVAVFRECTMKGNKVRCVVIRLSMFNERNGILPKLAQGALWASRCNFVCRSSVKAILYECRTPTTRQSKP